MKLYKLTKLGRQAIHTLDGTTDPDEKRILDYLKDYKTGTDSQLAMAGETWVVRSLVRQKLIKELTEGG